MAAPAPPKGWRVEYAKSNRASCKTCNNLIGKDSLRIAKVIQSTKFDGFMTIWHHSRCILSKPGRIQSLDDVEGVDDLRWEDAQKLKKYVDDGGGKKVGKEDDDADGEAPRAEAGSGDYAVENAKSSRATCKSCNEKIMKGEVRISTMVASESSRFPGKVPAWRHAKCFMELGWFVKPVESLPGWDTLSTEDQKELKGLAKSGSTTSNTDGQGSKRKLPPADEETLTVNNDKKSRKKGIKEASPPAEKKKMVSSPKGQEKTAASDDKATEVEKKLEQQNKELWALKDELKKYVTTPEFRSMLAANSMDVSGTDQALRDRCADGMMFGALPNCPMCQSPIEYGDGQYRCKGFLTAWSKCSYTTLAPKRKAGKWKIPSDLENDFLDQWNKKQKAKKEERLLLPPSSPAKPVMKPEVMAPPKNSSSKSSSSGGPLQGLSIAMIGRLGMSQARYKELIEQLGGSLSSVKEGTYCVLAKESEIERQKDRLHHALSLNIPIVKEEYILECHERETRLPFTGFKVEVGLKAPAMTKIKVKGRSAVHEDSGLQDTGHILEVGKVIYNVTLNLSDLSTGINSYYILQIIEDDNKNVHHLFRKWGRVGNSKIGDHKLERLGRVKVMDEFRRLFVEKTGNSWKAWENKEDLEKQPGKFYVVDIDFGVDEEASPKAAVPAGSKSKLDPRVVDLMKLLFDIETYRAALMEFEINMSEMPLGKLSKRHIERGFQVLTEIQNLLDGKSSQKDGLLVDASNRFFTLIPSVHPNVIRDKELLKAKIDMLEALRDIEIASQLIGSVGNGNEDPLDINYRKLHCGISPLPHDSDDFKLVKKYLERTHAPTHREWQLELEDVFEVDREGESDAYAPYKKDMKNRMLLWHGSRTTNYVGILSQGLRIAPPEAPVTGYMFGKGLYFADLVSKSAQYCYTSKKNPTGLLLLCEVALGKTKELKSAKYMENPMSGTHSTKGVGKTVPLKSEFEVWDDNVTVPCGRPVTSGSSDSNLLYNEYIVYDTAQVQLRFLLKVNFKHKR
ncbi:unnamed protein product [Calypogeia fissa]